MDKTFIFHWISLNFMLLLNNVKEPMFKKVGSFVFTTFKYYCVVHCVTEHVADIFLVSSYFCCEFKPLI